jgi:hypothetical protein
MKVVISDVLESHARGYSKEEIKEEKETKTTNYVRKDLNCY